jgi:hypothetical protein
MMNILFIGLFLFVVVNTIQIPFIDNVIFAAISNSSSTLITNRTCNQCLCMSYSSYMALNCFANNTCQLFSTFPRAYKLQSVSLARLYFVQQIFPNASQCCVSNTSYLLDKLNSTAAIYATVLQPRCIVFDNNGYLVTLSQANNTIVRLYPTNLTIVRQPSSPKFDTTPMTITYYNEAYYVGFDSFILVIDSSVFTILYNITAPYLDGTRGMIFLNSGQTMLVASTSNNSIIFLNQTTSTSKNYNFINKQSVNYSYPHGFWYMNDTYVYLTSWSDSTIYSYAATNISTVWTQNLFLDAKPIATADNGNHLTFDECNRCWYSLGTSGIRIFNNQGAFVANFTQMVSAPFDTLITDNYVIYISDTGTNKIMRINPNILCSYD